MAAHAGLNKNNSAVKRIMREARELANDPCTDYAAAPLEDDIFEWHCTIRGPPGTEFEGGLYHFRILLPAEYPFRPPAIMMLTPNGRFELNTKICISFTNYHEELWQPAWGVRTAIIGLQGFFPLKGTAAVGVGALEYPTAERKRLAALSRDWVCPRCKRANIEHLPDPPASESSSSEDSSSSAANSTTTPSPAPAPAPPILVPSEAIPQDTPKPSPSQAAEDVLLQVPKPEAPIIHRPIPLVAPKPTRPHAHASIVTQSFTPPRVPTPEQPATRDQTPQPALVAAVRQTPPRPPILLDTVICVLLVLMFALVARRIL
ncbi:ubiquitin-conjugating enzyme/RWD-like protein [Earliella scabrosa]|nr:ubiquitin-conjugating enzyme/RWD-like protein [Earliella scabrosa]